MRYGRQQQQQQEVEVELEVEAQQYQICQEQLYKHDEAKMAAVATRTTTFAMDDGDAGGINNSATQQQHPTSRRRRRHSEDEEDSPVNRRRNGQSGPRIVEDHEFAESMEESGCHGLTSCNESAHNHQHHEKTAFSSFHARRSNQSLLFLVVTLLLLVLGGPQPGSAFNLDGSQNSFAQFRKWYTGLNGTLELEFKSEQPNGLVLYTDDGGTYDFFELKLVEGVLRLRYNLGGGAQIITVGRDLHDGHWHKVQVRRA